MSMQRYSWVVFSVGLATLLVSLSGCSTKGASNSRSEAEEAVAKIPLSALKFSVAEPNPIELQPVSQLANLDAPLPRPIKNAKILISKAERKLKLYSGETLLRIYPVSLGWNPRDDKVCQGDGRTPEGDFYVCTKNPRSKFYLSLGLSYPSVEDAKRGLKDGLISTRQFHAITKAIERGRIPLWDTPLGGEIFIHGGGVAWDWTQGCIALDDQDIEELFASVTVGARVQIH